MGVAIADALHRELTAILIEDEHLVGAGLDLNPWTVGVLVEAVAETKVDRPILAAQRRTRRYARRTRTEDSDRVRSRAHREEIAAKEPTPRRVVWTPSFALIGEPRFDARPSEHVVLPEPVADERLAELVNRFVKELPFCFHCLLLLRSAPECLTFVVHVRFLASLGMTRRRNRSGTRFLRSQYRVVRFLTPASPPFGMTKWGEECTGVLGPACGGVVGFPTTVYDTSGGWECQARSRAEKLQNAVIASKAKQSRSLH